MKNFFLIANTLLISGCIFSQTNTFPTTGNVGIGTITPKSKLDLGNNYSNPSTYPNKINLWSNGDNNYFGFGVSLNTLDYFSQGNHRFFTGYNGNPGSEKMVIKTNGDVDIFGNTKITENLKIEKKIGIGLQNNLNPNSKIDLGYNYSNPSEYPNKITLWSNGEYNYFGFGISLNTLDYFSQGDHRFLTEYNGTPGSEKMIIKTNGNIGIGTTNPTEKLHVEGTILSNRYKIGYSEFTPDQGGAIILKADLQSARPYLDFDKFGETDYFTSRLTLIPPQTYTNNESKLTLLGSSTLTLQKGLEFLDSNWSNGFGSKIYGTDNGNGSTSLRFAVRANSNTFTDAMVIKTESGNVGIGTTEPGGKLDINLGGWGNISRIVFRSLNDNPGINFYRPTGTAQTAYPWRIEENFGALEFQTGTFSNIGQESLKTSLTINKYNLEIGTGNNTNGERSSIIINGFDSNAKFSGTLHSNWEENQRTFDIYTNNQVSQLKIDASANPDGKILLLPGANANVGIGTLNPDEKLTVNGKIHAKEVKIDLNIAPDYVFEKYYTGFSNLNNAYKMPTLDEVETFTKEHHHLPEVPSAQEIKENGLEVGEMNKILLQKVEELTLYLIEQKKEIEALKTKVNELSKE